MAGGPAVRLYRAEWSTNCERVGLALAYKGIEAQSVLIEYSNRAPVEAISGQGLVPVIEDAGEVISDSVAIMRHLDRRTPEPPLFPAEPTCRAGVEVFIGWFESVYKAAPNAIEAELEKDAPDDALIERLGAEMTARLTCSRACSPAATTWSRVSSRRPTSSPTRSSSTRCTATPPTPSSST